MVVTIDEYPDNTSLTLGYSNYSVGDDDWFYFFRYDNWVFYPSKNVIYTNSNVRDDGNHPDNIPTSPNGTALIEGGPYKNASQNMLFGRGVGEILQANSYWT
jgi:hypothetical protein